MTQERKSFAIEIIQRSQPGQTIEIGESTYLVTVSGLCNILTGEIVAKSEVCNSPEFDSGISWSCGIVYLMESRLGNDIQFLGRVVTSSMEELEAWLYEKDPEDDEDIDEIKTNVFRFLELYSNCIAKA